MTARHVVLPGSSRWPGPLAERYEGVDGVPLGGDLLAGAEPTLRADLPALLAVLPAMRTDGFVLADDRGADSLIRAGLRHVRVVTLSSRTDAAAWLSGSPHAHRAWQAIRKARARSLPVDVEIPLSRPLLPHLAETVELAARLGADRAVLSRVPARGPESVAVVPRWPLLDAPIREAVRVGLPLLQSGFPDCAVALPREDAVAVDVGGNPAPIPTEGACPRCTCAGFPVDHVDLYGIGDTLPAPSPAAEAAFQLDHDARTRDARLALCRVAATGAETLILSGSWSRHPQAEELLREALRLFPEVRAEGDLTPLADWTDDARHRVRKVRFVDTPR